SSASRCSRCRSISTQARHWSPCSAAARPPCCSGWPARGPRLPPDRRSNCARRDPIRPNCDEVLGRVRSLDTGRPKHDIVGESGQRAGGKDSNTMADYEDRALRSQSAAAGLVDTGLRSYMLRVYNYMLVGLLLTGATAYAVAEIPAIRALVFFISFRITRMSLATAQTSFWAYAGINGIALAPIVLAYAGADVAQAFFVTAATFGAMSLYGYTTQRDLTGFGSFLFMGLIGIVIAMIVQFFLQSAVMNFVISVIGVLVFTGLTAYDTQWIKNAYVSGDDTATAGKKAIYGALKLYLDFINLFLFILRLMGNGRR